MQILIEMEIESMGVIQLTTIVQLSWFINQLKSHKAIKNVKKIFTNENVWYCSTNGAQ